MNLDQPCMRCMHPRREHRGNTHQGACPENSQFMIMETLRGNLPIPYKDRIWKGGYPYLRGPWRILEDCPAATHNTRDSVDRPRKHVRCICPRAQSLLKARNAQRSANHVVWKQQRKEDPVIIAQRVTVTQPDLSAGLCTSPVGRQISSDAYDFSRAHPRAVKMCEGCPMLDRCRAYVLEAEKPAGAWGGVWGGLTPSDRRRLARQK